jgi:heat shock protein HslJ
MYRFNLTDGGDILPEPSAPQTSLMTEVEARALAEVSCVKGGEALGAGTYNPNSKTWWFDANLNATQPGCNPACVVFEETRTTEINWRCTGLIPAEEGVSTGKGGNEEAIPNTLTGKTWVLADVTRADGTSFIPKRADAFTLTFSEDGSVGIGTDCNNMGGQYSVSGPLLTIQNIFSTMMYCEGSQEGDFSALLGEVTAWDISANTLELSNSAGMRMWFK